MDDFDASGWWVGRAEPWPRAWTLFAREDDSRMVEARWLQQAKRFFNAHVAVSPQKHYPGGGQPRVDRASVQIGVGEEAPRRLWVHTMPADAAEALRRDALAVADGGMDVLIRRAPRIWQWRAEDAEGAKRAELLMAALLASVLLGPVWRPGEGSVFGVRGARERLSQT